MFIFSKLTDSRACHFIYSWTFWCVFQGFDHNQIPAAAPSAASFKIQKLPKCVVTQT